MHLRQLTIPLLTLLPLLAAAGGAQTPERHAAATAAVAGTAGEEPAAADTVIVVDKVQVTAIKQGMVLRSQPVAATIVGSRAIERERIGALKHLSQQVPNFFAPDYGSRMTSSIYVRGLGARIDQPVMGLNIDNVPVLNKDNYDTELADAERIEVLRGPQSTLYGRNTMGGVINVYTLSPLSYEGVRLSAEYGSGDSYKFRASSYYKLTPDLGMAVTGYYTHTGGFFENLATGDKCDWERLGGGRWKTQWRNRTGLRIDNTLSFSVLEQGGYPYAYVGDDIIGDDGRPVVRRGEIRYNDPCSYRRTALSDGLTIRYDAGNFTVASITCYQYSDDEMILDQDFLPLSYFTLRQARTEHSVTEDLVFRSRGDKAYRWLLGAFGFYRHGTMNAPVHFKQTGIEELILKYANENDQSYRYSWGLKDGADGGDQLVGELLTGDIHDDEIGVGALDLGLNGGQQMGLAKAGAAVDEQGVIGPGGVCRHSLRSSKRKLVGRPLDEVFKGELIVALRGGGVCLVLLGQHYFVGRGAGHHKGDVHINAQHGLEGLLEQAKIRVGDDLADKLVAHRQGEMAGVLKADGLQPVDIEIVRWLGHLRLAVHLGRF